MIEGVVWVFEEPEWAQRASAGGFKSRDISERLKVHGAPVRNSSSWCRSQYWRFSCCCTLAMLSSADRGRHAERTAAIDACGTDDLSADEDERAPLPSGANCS